MGGLQIPSCSNCRHLGTSTLEPCLSCIEEPDAMPTYEYWQSRRGSKAGAPRKSGAGRTKFKDQGEKKQVMILSFKENDVTKAGGYKKVQADLEKAFYDKIK